MYHNKGVKTTPKIIHSQNETSQLVIAAQYTIFGRNPSRVGRGCGWMAGRARHDADSELTTAVLWLYSALPNLTNCRFCLSGFIQNLGLAPADVGWAI